MRNEKFKGWLPVDSYTLHPRKEKVICALQMRTNEDSLFNLLGALQALLQSRCVSCGFSVRNRFIKDTSGETNGETWFKVLAIILESFTFLSGFLDAIHGVALRVALMRTPCLRLLWWGCLGARFRDIPIPSHSCRLVQSFTRPGFLARWRAGIQEFRYWWQPTTWF